MKRIVSLAVAIILTLSFLLTSCAGVDNDGDTTTAAGTTADSTVKEIYNTVVPSDGTTAEAPKNETSETPEETEAPEVPEKPASVGLNFSSNGDGTCYIRGMGTCTATEVIIPSVSPEGDTVTAIGDDAFKNRTDIISVSFPDSITYIGIRAFYGCSGLTSIELPESIEKIDGAAFQRCYALANITLPDKVIEMNFATFNNTTYHSTESNWQNGILYVGKHLICAESNISGQCSIKPGTLTIADYAFDRCKSLTGVTIPNSVEHIGMYAFTECTALTEISIPDSVKKIGDNAFYRCEMLADIEMPSEVIDVGLNAFYETGYYTDPANRENGVLYIGTYLIEADPDILEVNIKDGTAVVESSAFYSRTEMESITVPGSVRYIEAEAFYNCKKLTDITFEGTKEEWAAIEKGEDWNELTGEYTVHCTDGDIAKADS